MQYGERERPEAHEQGYTGEIQVAHAPRTASILESLTLARTALLTTNFSTLILQSVATSPPAHKANSLFLPYPYSAANPSVDDK
jgi:hypothetical protein